MRRLRLTRCYAAAVMVAGMAMLGCGSGEAPPTVSIPAPEKEAPTPQTPAPNAMASAFPIPDGPTVREPNVAPEVIIETNLGEFRLRLDGKEVPITVGNFLENYVDQGFYTETIFHHVDSEVVVGGGYLADLTEKQTRIPIQNEASRGRKNTRGTIGMVRKPDYSASATSQFYINLVDVPALDPDEATENDGYCVFGEVISGLEILDQMAKVTVHEVEGFPMMPVDPVVIKSIRRADP